MAIGRAEPARLAAAVLVGLPIVGGTEDAAVALLARREPVAHEAHHAVEHGEHHRRRAKLCLGRD